MRIDKNYKDLLGKTVALKGVKGKVVGGRYGYSGGDYYPNKIWIGSNTEQDKFKPLPYERGNIEIQAPYYREIDLCYDEIKILDEDTILNNENEIEIVNGISNSENPFILSEKLFPVDKSCEFTFGNKKKYD